MNLSELQASLGYMTRPCLEDWGRGTEVRPDGYDLRGV